MLWHWSCSPAFISTEMILEPMEQHALEPRKRFNGKPRNQFDLEQLTWLNLVWNGGNNSTETGEIRLHRRCLRRDHPDGIKHCKVQVYLGWGDGGISLPQRCVFSRSQHRTSLFSQYGIDMFVHAPARNRQDKTQKNMRFFVFGSQFSVLRRVFFRRVLSKAGEASLAIEGFFAIFVGQKHWFLPCFCVLPRLEGFTRTGKRKKNV